MLRFERLAALFFRRKPSPPRTPPAQPWPRPERPYAIPFCDRGCPKRAGCGLRHATLYLAELHQVCEELPNKPPSIRAWIDTSLKPIVNMLIRDRSECASRELDQYMARERAQVRAEMRAGPSTVRPESNKQAAQAPAAAPKTISSPTAPSAPPSSSHRAPPAFPHLVGPFSDQKIWDLIQQARARHSDDDAAAWRLLLATTNLTQTQVARVAKQHGLRGWSKTNLTTWRDPNAKSSHSLNHERRARTTTTPRSNTQEGSS